MGACVNKEQVSQSDARGAHQQQVVNSQMQQVQVQVQMQVQQRHHMQQPQPQPQPQQPRIVAPEVVTARTIVNYTHLLKDSLVLRKAEASGSFHLAFLVDATVSCIASIFFNCEELGSVSGNISFKPLSSTTQLQPLRPKKMGDGSSIEYTTEQPIDFTNLSPNINNKINQWPLVIQLESTPQGGKPQYQYTYTKVKIETESIEVGMQKLQVGNEVFEVEDIYGANIDEGGQVEGTALSAVQDEGCTCVICLEGEREVLIMPCRHKCLCASCAADLRRETNKCPMCRRGIESLLTSTTTPRPS
eukprot:TRINITY_DN883_c2_g2_i1.p1 TRINITY_DN883_c2_g2~~TRINITY_DN883_c2_g2_i1.p1  ORF type:complete len:322 (+),score=43.37 TRINITY_DN883_c2_g2_i1:59-967(+)